MSAIARAIKRGEDARNKKQSKWEPIGVTYPGWLTARFRKVEDGTTEGVFYAQGCWQLTTLGLDKKTDKVKSFDVRDRELKRMAKAMLQPDAEERDLLITEAAAVRNADMNKRAKEGKKPKRARRGKQ